jgi:hypothetical protein
MKSTGGNSTYKKLAFQCLNEVFYFVSSAVEADSFVLRKRQLLGSCKTLVASVGNKIESNEY